MTGEILPQRQHFTKWPSWQLVTRATSYAWR